LQGSLRAFNYDPAAVVATHDIHCNSHKQTGSGERRSAAGNPSGSGSHGNDLAPLVIAAGGANPVGHVRGRALRTRTELRQGQHAVIRAAHALTTSRRFSLRDTHNYLKFQFV
jgi:hypothetical protein